MTPIHQRTQRDAAGKKKRDAGLVAVTAWIPAEQMERIKTFRDAHAFTRQDDAIRELIEAGLAHYQESSTTP